MRGIDPVAFLADAAAKGLICTVGPASRLAELDAVAPPAAKAKPVAKGGLVPAAFLPPGCWLIPVATASEANGRDWRARSSRTQAARRAVSRVMGPTLAYLAEFARQYHAGRPLRAVLTRLGGRWLDPGNVSAALKAVEDAVCLLMGADDGDDRWRPEYRQEPGGLVGVRVELFTITKGSQP